MILKRKFCIKIKKNMKNLTRSPSLRNVVEDEGFICFVNIRETVDLFISLIKTAVIIEDLYIFYFLLKSKTCVECSSSCIWRFVVVV